MKKIFPILIFSLFSIFLLSSKYLNKISSQTQASTKEGNKHSLYEKNLKSFKTKNFKGEKIDFEEIKEPIIIINFWASWCLPCISEFKSLNKLLSTHGESIYVIGINNDEEGDVKSMLKVEKKYKLKFSSIFDPGGKYADKFLVTAIPSTFVYHKGKIIYVSLKELDFMNEDFVKLLKNYL